MKKSNLINGNKVQQTYILNHYVYDIIYNSISQSHYQKMDDR